MNQLEQQLHKHFGFASFRRGQQDAVAAASSGNDVLVVMPTGAGKSLCYQLPALMRDDLTLIVSPLVALMHDQVEQLQARAPGRAGLVSSQQDSELNQQVIEKATRGELSLLYVSPERFSSPYFAHAMRAANVGLFVVDEAHCVSHWGHDFRPDYFRLADAARWLDAEAIIALTATATPQVADDIVKRLRLQNPVRITTGFDRPNLSFSVIPASAPAVKTRAIREALEDANARPAIVYCGTRQRTELLAQELRSQSGDDVVVYHAGLDREQRAEAQTRFMRGESSIVVATNAFGMGIDKSDVRTVIHETVPPSLESYYQEAGRAGRDGQPAKSLLFASPRDKGLHVFFIERAEPDLDGVGRLAAFISKQSVDSTFDIAIDDALRQLKTHKYGEDVLRTVAGALTRAKIIQPAPSPSGRLRGRVLGEFDRRAKATCRSFTREAQRVRWRQYRAIWGYVEGNKCRRRVLLEHFGDAAPSSTRFGCCDVCD